MSALPKHGQINCTECFSRPTVEFDVSLEGTNHWRIKANPLAWGTIEPKVIVLGFSKGPTQNGALKNMPHDQIAYKGSRGNVGKILSHIGLLNIEPNEGPADSVDRIIQDKNGDFHFGSLIRCTVERFDESSSSWKGSGGGMLDKFIATSFGKKVAQNCTKRYLSSLPIQTKLVVMFGLGTKLNYVKASYGLFSTARPGKWEYLNDVSYTDGQITVVHVEHFASQGALIPNWLGVNNHDRANYGFQAQEGVKRSGVATASKSK